MKKIKIAIIGHFGGKKKLYDGQTITTRTLYDELSKLIDVDIYKVDTYDKKSNIFRLIFRTFYCLTTQKKIFILLSENGMKVYFPLLNWFGKIFHFDVYHYVIGGRLAELSDKHKNWAYYLNDFKINWVGLQTMNDKLINRGINNGRVIPTIRRVTPIEKKYVKHYDWLKPFKFCTFSRVSYEKGIEDAVNAINHINEKANSVIVTLDIYGQVDQNYVSRFNFIKEKFTDAIHYKGIVDYHESIKVLSEYYVLLFPTFWQGEGFPGTIIDAYASGLPVIATDWNGNRELILQYKTGIIYPDGQINNLEEAIEWSINHSEKIMDMKAECLIELNKYLPDPIIKEILATVL